MTEPDRHTLAALAAAIAARAARAVPAAFDVHALDCTLAIHPPGEPEARTIDLSSLLQQGHGRAPALEIAALAALNDMQDEIIESLRRAWPTDTGHAAPAQPYAETTPDGHLILGYRYDHRPHPTLALPPIPTSDL